MLIILCSLLFHSEPQELCLADGKQKDKTGKKFHSRIVGFQCDSDRAIQVILKTDRLKFYNKAYSVK